MRTKALKVAGASAAVGLGSLIAAGPATAHQGRPFRVALSGAQEVPANPHGAADRGRAWVKLDARQGRVCWKFGRLALSGGDALPTAAHIHEAPRGVAGPVVVTLFGPPANAAAAPTSYPTPVRCVPADPALVTRIRQNPAGFYVNMHNAQHPSGVVRGQLDGPRKHVRADDDRKDHRADRQERRHR